MKSAYNYSINSNNINEDSTSNGGSVLYASIKLRIAKSKHKYPNMLLNNRVNET